MVIKRNDPAFWRDQRQQLESIQIPQGTDPKAHLLSTGWRLSSEGRFYPALRSHMLAIGSVMTGLCDEAAVHACLDCVRERRPDFFRVMHNIVDRYQARELPLSALDLRQYVTQREIRIPGEFEIDSDDPTGPIFVRRHAVDRWGERFDVLRGRAAFARAHAQNLETVPCQVLQLVPDGSDQGVMHDLRTALVELCRHLENEAIATQDSTSPTNTTDLEAEAYQPRQANRVTEERSRQSDRMAIRKPWLNDKLVAKRLNILRLSELSGVGRSSIYDWRDGRTEQLKGPSRDAIATVLGVAVSDMPE